MALNSREQRAKSRGQNLKSREILFFKTKSTIIFVIYYFILYTFHFSLFTFYVGCATLQQRESILAVVNGEPITEGDLAYSLTITHRREDLSSAGSLRLRDYIQKIVDDRLIIEEARRSGMDQLPEIKKAVQAYILRESVVRLHDDEIVKKVSVSEKEILDYYNDNYRQYRLGYIELTSEKNAKEIYEKLLKGEKFEELAKRYSIHASRDKGGELVLKKNAIPSYIMEAISGLKQGEISEIVKKFDRYYIVKFIEKEDAPGGEEFEKNKKRIETIIRKEKENKRSEEYLKYLREKANVKINEELLSKINLEAKKEEIEKWYDDESPLVKIDSIILTVGDFVKMARPSTRRTKKDILERWIDRKLVDIEALKRHYDRTPDLKKKIHRYENQLLKNTFIRRIILPQIVIDDKIAKDYYLKHQKLFMRPARYKIQQITVQDKHEAQGILNSLKTGADFTWLAKRRSIDSFAEKGGNAGWFIKSQLPISLQEIIDTLKPGDISPVLENNAQYLIILLRDKIDEKVKEYNEVKDSVYRKCYNEQVEKIYNDYVDELKKEAKIKFYDKEIQELEEKFLK